jgi:hypothetical protein
LNISFNTIVAVHIPGLGLASGATQLSMHGNPFQCKLTSETFDHGNVRCWVDGAAAAAAAPSVASADPSLQVTLVALDSTADGTIDWASDLLAWLMATEQAEDIVGSEQISVTELRITFASVETRDKVHQLLSAANISAELVLPAGAQLRLAASSASTEDSKPAVEALWMYLVIGLGCFSVILLLVLVVTVKSRETLRRQKPRQKAGNAKGAPSVGPPRQKMTGPSPIYEVPDLSGDHVIYEPKSKFTALDMDEQTYDHPQVPWPAKNKREKKEKRKRISENLKVGKKNRKR